MSSASAMSNPAASFDSFRQRLLGLAYRMLGSVADAEDAVQERYLRWHGADRGNVLDPRAFLMTTTTRICLSMLTSARARREEYVGPWLPEPVVDTRALAPDSRTELAEDLSIALFDARSTVAARTGGVPTARRVRFLVRRSGRGIGARRGGVPSAGRARTCARFDRAARLRRRRVRARSMRSISSSCPPSWQPPVRVISMH